VAAATAVVVSIIGRRPVPFELEAAALATDTCSSRHIPLCTHMDVLQCPTMTQNGHFPQGDDLV
jgi:hypothetical protein